MGKRPQNSKSKRRWRLSHSKGPHTDAVRNDINVTPLVDVMLVLLIIFMLMTLVMGRGHDVPLPKAANFSEEKDKNQPVITIDAGGILWVEKERIGAIDQANLKEMKLRVEALWKGKAADAAGRIYLKADNGIDYGTVFPVLQFLNKDMLLESVDLAVAKNEGK
ncbi:MAG TPA: biopolymer transporter ExbD [Kofleriaceae bacterium]|jgi:biopolymer transport protein ExbD